VLERIVQSRRNKQAALRLLCKLLKDQGTAQYPDEREPAYKKGSAFKAIFW
jgi:hypothetical protein